MFAVDVHTIYNTFVCMCWRGFIIIIHNFLAFDEYDSIWEGMKIKEHIEFLSIRTLRNSNDHPLGG